MGSVSDFGEVRQEAGGKPAPALHMTAQHARNARDGVLAVTENRSARAGSSLPA